MRIRTIQGNYYPHNIGLAIVRRGNKRTKYHNISVASQNRILGLIDNYEYTSLLRPSEMCKITVENWPINA